MQCRVIITQARCETTVRRRTPSWPLPVKSRSHFHLRGCTIGAEEFLSVSERN